MSVHRRVAVAMTVLAVLIIVTGVIEAVTDAGGLWYVVVILIAAAVSLMLRALRMERQEVFQDAVAADSAQREGAWQRTLAEPADATDRRGSGGGADGDTRPGT